MGPTVEGGSAESVPPPSTDATYDDEDDLVRQRELCVGAHALPALGALPSHDFELRRSCCWTAPTADGSLPVLSLIWSRRHHVVQRLCLWVCGTLEVARL